MILSIITVTQQKLEQCIMSQHSQLSNIVNNPNLQLKLINI